MHCRLSIDKKGPQADSCAGGGGGGRSDDDVDPLDTTIVGPWLSYWPMPHQNKHTRAWAAVQGAAAAGGA